MGVDSMSIITRDIGRLNIKLRLSIRIFGRYLHNIEYQRHIRFFDPEYLGVDTRIVILCQLKIRARLNFNLGYLWTIIA